MGILRVNRTGGDLKCKGHETRKRWKKRVTQVRGTKRQEKWSDKGKRGGAILRDGFPAGERTKKKTFQEQTVS